MPIKMTFDEFEEQFEEADKSQLHWDASDKLDITRGYDAQITQGWRREIRLREGLFLEIDRHRLCDHLFLNSQTVRQGFVETWFVLSGQGEQIYASKSSEFVGQSVPGQYFTRGIGILPPRTVVGVYFPVA